MKNQAKSIPAVLLVFLLIVSLAGCGAKEPTLLNEKVVKMIDLDVVRDTEGTYSMLYPDMTDIETFRSTAEMIYEYFPVTAGYTWELQQWNITKGIGNKTEVYDGQYVVEFDGRVFYIIATWCSDEEGSGFTRFQIINEEDWLSAQKE